MKRVLAILSLPIVLSACVDKNPIDENAGRVYDWYLTHISSGEHPVSRQVGKECGDAVLANKTSDPACEQWATYFTSALNASSALDDTVEQNDWYSKNFWSKYNANYKSAAEVAKETDEMKAKFSW